MKADDIALIARTMTPVVREFVAQQQQTLVDKLAAMELRVLSAEQRAIAAEQRAMTPGPAGPAGPVGPAGQPGKDGAPGIAGKDGAPGLNGKDGPMGPRGEKGLDGAPGIAGKDGAVGLNGKDGNDGKDGAIGPRGEKGLDGAPGIAGKDGAPGLHGKDAVLPDIAAIVKTAVGQLTVPKDGRSVTLEELAPLVIAEVHKAVASIPPAQPPVHVTGAVIERDGILVLTQSDGSVKRIGPVVGKDGTDGRPGADVAPELIAELVKSAVDQIPTPKDGRDGVDGIGFDDLSLVFDDQSGFALRCVRGSVEKVWPVPVPHYKGIWQSGRTYVAGATVTVKGALWIALTDTAARPGDDSAASRAWKLCVKPGRDGKDGGS